MGVGRRSACLLPKGSGRDKRGNLVATGKGSTLRQRAWMKAGLEARGEEG